MIKIDPIIAVKDVEASSEWYEQVFGFERKYGGKDHFAVLLSNDQVVLCLHKWESDGHPTMTNTKITPGNGIILYFRVENMDAIRQNVKKTGVAVEEEVHLNPNSLRKEFSILDPDGYYLTITEFHNYAG